MSYSDGRHPPYSGVPRAGSPHLYPLVLLVAAIVIGFLAWRVFGSRGSPLDPSAEPRAVTPRGSLSEFENTTIELFRQASPSVVHIRTSQLRSGGFGRNIMEIPQGTGSGFIWDDKGYIVTNAHVVAGADRCEVILSDESRYDGIIVGGDPDKDLAVLKIPDAPRSKLKPIPVGTSEDLLVGQSVIAIGNPFGLDQTLTTGVISGLDREIRSLSDRPIRGVIQTDAAINPGNSGGPLLDSAGRLIGVNTAILSRSGSYAGVGFAVPVDVVNRITPQIIRSGRRERPGLGVTLLSDSDTRSIKRQFGHPLGARIHRVYPGSAAEKAGLRPTLVKRGNSLELGDLILRVGDQEIRKNDDLLAALGEYDVGDEVELEIFRDREEGPVTVTVKLQAIQ